MKRLVIKPTSIVDISGASPQQAESNQRLTAAILGNGIEWSPVATSDGKAITFFHSDARRPGRAAIQIGVEIEQLIFPDEIHDFLRHENWLRPYHASSNFFDRHLKRP